MNILKMFDPNYYTNRKQELSQENFKNIIEGYQDIERIVIKNINKARDLQSKLQQLESQEAQSKEQSNKKDGIPPSEPEPARPAKSKK